MKARVDITHSHFAFWETPLRDAKSTPQVIDFKCVKHASNRTFEGRAYERNAVRLFSKVSYSFLTRWSASC
ncbi:protein of unknown function [Pararobbsia alpina]